MDDLTVGGKCLFMHKMVFLRSIESINVHIKFTFESIWPYHALPMLLLLLLTCRCLVNCDHRPVRFLFAFVTKILLHSLVALMAHTPPPPPSPPPSPAVLDYVSDWMNMDIIQMKWDNQNHCRRGCHHPVKSFSLMMFCLSIVEEDDVFLFSFE